MRIPAGRAVLVILLVPILGYVVWDQVESRALARQLAAIAARGEPISTVEEPFGADTGERHDAARIYAAAARRVVQLPSERTFGLWRIDVDNLGGQPVKLEDLETWYRPDAPPLQLADQAAPLDFNGFGDVAPDLTINSNSLQTLAALCDVRADLFSVRGHGDAAAASLTSSARVTRATPETFARMLQSMRLLGSVRILLRHTQPSETSLAELQRALQALPDADQLVGDVQKTRARFLDLLSRPRNTPAETILARILRPWVARGARRQLAAFEDALAVARQPWPQKLVAADALEQKYSARIQALNRRGIIDRVTLPFGGVAFLSPRNAGVDLAARRVSIAALAIERYRRAHGGALPAALDALVPAFLPAAPVDPFSGASLVYKISATGYALYSVDSDRKDDGGALYGLGSHSQLSPRLGTPRDLGIRVELRR